MNETITRVMADGAVIPVVLIGVWALLFRLPKGTNRLHAYSRVLMAGLTAYMVAKLIGQVYQPEQLRPFELLGTSAGAAYLANPGFPSDHMLFCMTITLAVWFETRDKLITAILLVLTAIVGLGRVFALVHTPLDVIGGIVIACSGIPWYLQRPKEESSSKAGTEARKKSNHAVK